MAEPQGPHIRVFEYDGAFKCLDCGVMWGALPDNPTMPETCDKRPCTHTPSEHSWGGIGQDCEGFGIRRITVAKAEQAEFLQFELTEARRILDNAKRIAMEETIRAIDAAKEVETLTKALEESVKLQSHYAKLLNQYDGGKRLQFEDAATWIARLAKLAREEKSSDPSGSSQ